MPFEKLQVNLEDVLNEAQREKQCMISLISGIFFKKEKYKEKFTEIENKMVVIRGGKMKDEMRIFCTRVKSCRYVG